jgi:hypothetical protein
MLVTNSHSLNIVALNDDRHKQLSINLAALTDDRHKQRTVIESRSCEKRQPEVFKGNFRKYTGRTLSIAALLVAGHKEQYDWV